MPRTRQMQTAPVFCPVVETFDVQGIDFF